MRTIQISREYEQKQISRNFLTLFDMGGMMAPKMFLATVLKCYGEGSSNFVTFNINLWKIKQSYFWLPRLSGVTIKTSLSGST